MAAKNVHASTKREAIAEKKGYLLRHYMLNNRDVYIPVRKAALDQLYNDTAATHAIFVQKTSELLLASDQGYVVKYDISTLLKNLQIKPVTLKTKTIQDIQGGEPQILVLGYNEQQIPKRLLTNENSGRLIPLLHAHNSL